MLHPIRITLVWVVMLMVGLNLTGCKRTEPDALPEPVTLVNSTLIGTYTKSQLLQRAGGLFGTQSNQLIALLLQRDIQAYRLVYKTKNADNTDVNASGVLIVPVAIGNESFPIVSQQHGTIFDDALAPSNFAQTSEAGSVGALFASNGYILSCPDYIGFGESKNVPHPYLHRQTEAQASLDMLRASREFLARNNGKWDNRVFLSGYSQGGHATMALLKMMEEQYPTEFTLTAATCGAGPYNVEGVMQDLVNTRTSGVAAYNRVYVWVLQTYNRVYGLNRPMSAFFKEPYATDVQINGLGANINVSLNTAFTDAFRTGVSSGSDAAFLTAVRDNNVYNWGPKTPLQLYQGTADQLVFYRNMTDAADAMRVKGATSVEAVPVPGGDHSTTVQNYLAGTFTFFNSKK